MYFFMKLVLVTFLYKKKNKVNKDNLRLSILRTPESIWLIFIIHITYIRSVSTS